MVDVITQDAVTPVESAPRRTWGEIQALLLPTPDEARWMRSAYVSSRFTNRDLVRAFSMKLATVPNPIYCIQSWPVSGDITFDRSESVLAEMDFFEIDSVPNFIQLTQGCELTPGGMHVEMGYAIAKGKHVTVIGPRVNIFHYAHGVVWFPSIQAYFKQAFGESWT